MERQLYSLRMRASRGGYHQSGAEKVVAADEVASVAAALMARAMNGSGHQPDAVHCSLECLEPASIRRAVLPDIATFLVSDWCAGRCLASRLLVRAGVSERVVSLAMKLLAEGAGPDGRVMRGAVVMNAQTGERLEGDASRGVRVSRMDLDSEARSTIEKLLAAAGLGHHRVVEALVLAAKVLGAPGIVAELCWSDDPDYVIGYVADPRYGYQRICNLKEQGDPRGGRIFFVNADRALGSLLEYLERQPVLFTALGRINSAKDWCDADE
jgi:6-carboxyhexanoate--CoA ligase